MKKRKFRYADGGDTVAEGRFDEDTYARARKFIEDQERRAGQGMANEEAPAPRARAAAPAASAAPSVSPASRSMEGMGRGRSVAAGIPVDTSMRGPAKEFSPAMGMSDTGRALATTVGALGGAGPAAIRAARTAPTVARTAIESAKAAAAPAARAAKEGIEVAKTAGPKAGMETARSTLRGMRSRADIQAKRGARQRSEAEAMEKAKPILKSRKDTKAERASRTRRSEEDSGIEFSRGGSASSRADGCAKRGKTRGKVY
jgi:hypothetical protein